MNAVTTNLSDTLSGDTQGTAYPRRDPTRARTATSGLALVVHTNPKRRRGNELQRESCPHSPDPVVVTRFIGSARANMGKGRGSCLSLPRVTLEHHQRHVVPLLAIPDVAADVLQ